MYLAIRICRHFHRERKEMKRETLKSQRVAQKRPKRFFLYYEGGERA